MGLSTKDNFSIVYVDHSTMQLVDIPYLEEQALRKKYQQTPKVDVELVKKLEQLESTDPVAINLVTLAAKGSRIDERELAALEALKQKYPLLRLVPKGGNPFDIGDPILEQQLKDEYIRLVQAYDKERSKSLVAYLEQRGAIFLGAKEGPFIAVEVQKSDIEQLARRTDVGRISLLSMEVGHPVGTLDAPSEQSDPATELSRIITRSNIVNNRGITGNGITVAVVEVDDVDFTSSDGSLCPAASRNCFKYTRTIPYQPNPAVGKHPTWVASAVASNYAQAPGPAYNAEILSSVMLGPLANDMSAAVRAAITGGAHIVNISYGWCDGNTYREGDQYLDYYARRDSRTIVVAAGNSGPLEECPSTSYVISPGLAWNAITVGNMDYRGTETRIDDIINPSSSYTNPDDSSYSFATREKPEIAAPGTNRVMMGIDGQLDTATGTSFAAPLVAGVSALMMERQPDLKTNPGAVKAILMASADHNVDRDIGIDRKTFEEDQRDGAGSINAELADNMANGKVAPPLTVAGACVTACYWTASLQNDILSQPYTYYIKANAGDRVRIADSWLAIADCGEYANGPICFSGDNDISLDMEIIDTATGISYGSSIVSGYFDNNYALIPNGNRETILEKTSTYAIRVKANKFNTASALVSFAFTKYGANTYDDTAASIQYNGPKNSQYMGINGGYGGTITSMPSGSSALLNFYGSSITFRYEHDLNSKADVYIDGQKRETLDMNHCMNFSSACNQIQKTWTVSQGSHTIKVVSVQGNVNVDAFIVDIPAANASYTYQATSPAIHMIPGAFGRTWRYKNLSGVDFIEAQMSHESFEFTFSTPSISIDYFAHSTGGMMNIFIDGVFKETIDTYALAVNPVVRSKVYTNLSAGIHTIYILNANQKNNDSNGYDIRFIRLTPQNGIPATPTPVTPTPSPTPAPSTEQVVSVGKFVTASSMQAGNDSSFGNDSSLTTRWSAASSSMPQYWEVDLGQYYDITKLVTTWYNGGTARSYKYKIEVSVNGTTWTLAKDRTSNTIKGTTTDTLSSFARYVRVTVTGASISGAYASAFDFSVYGTPSSLLSQNKASSGSSTQSGNDAWNANDGDNATRWSASSASMPQIWQVDLGQSHALTRVVTDWYNSTTNPRSYKYKIEVSTDANTWVVAKDRTTNTTQGTTTDTFSATGRYVRITVTGSSLSSSYASAYEFKVYGQP